MDEATKTSGGEGVKTPAMSRRDLLKAGLGSLGLVGVCNVLTGCATGSEALGVPGSFAPATKALGAKRWGLVVDVARLSEQGTFAHMLAACHTSHNVPSIDDRRIEVKWIWQDDFEHSFADIANGYTSQSLRQLAVPVLCNHCNEPVCVRVCPTQATFKRADGIVDMDYHRCIGCRFCMTACPYNARSLNFCDPRPYLDEINPAYPIRSKGVVEKCTFCAERIEQGLAPLCVEASNGALIFGDLSDASSDVRKVLHERFAVCRRAELGTEPSIYYLLAPAAGDVSGAVSEGGGGNAGKGV